MTSEHIDYIAEAIRGSFGDRCPEHADDCPTCEAWKQYDNLKVVPDVPELVRYGNYIDNRMHVKPTGEYVRYDQAAAMLAVEHQKTKDAEKLAFRMDRFAKKYLRHMRNAEQRAEAAEAELAQIKAQKPVAWRCKPYAANAAAWEYQDAPFNGRDPEFNEQQPLYAAPVDHTAEIERLREAINGMADEAGDAAYQFCRSYIGSEHEDAISSAVSARIQRVSEAALSGKEPS